MKNSENNPKITSADDFDNPIKELRQLPNIKLPNDFDSKLRNRIALQNEKKKSSAISFFSFSKPLVYGSSFIVVICISVLAILFMKNENKDSLNIPTVDSTEFEGKKVIIIPPTETMIEGDSKKSIEKITVQKEKKDKKEDVEEYFKTESDSKAASNPVLAPLSAPKTFRETTRLKADSTNKPDTVKTSIKKNK